jgi:hypothetical protein
VIRRWGWRNFTAAVRRELGATRWYSAIVRAVFDAATDPAHAEVGVSTQRAGALERVEFALADLAARRGEITEVEARMLSVLDELDLTELVTSIPGVSPSAPRRSWPSPVTPPGSPAPLDAHRRVGRAGNAGVGDRYRAPVITPSCSWWRRAGRRVRQR